MPIAEDPVAEFIHQGKDRALARIWTPFLGRVEGIVKYWAWACACDLRQRVRDPVRLLDPAFDVWETFR